MLMLLSLVAAHASPTQFKPIHQYRGETLSQASLTQDGTRLTYVVKRVRDRTYMQLETRRVGEIGGNWIINTPQSRNSPKGATLEANGLGAGLYSVGLNERRYLYRYDAETRQYRELYRKDSSFGEFPAFLSNADQSQAILEGKDSYLCRRYREMFGTYSVWRDLGTGETLGKIRYTELDDRSNLIWLEQKNAQVSSHLKWVLVRGGFRSCGGSERARELNGLYPHGASYLVSTQDLESGRLMDLGEVEWEGVRFTDSERFLLVPMKTGELRAYDTESSDWVHMGIRHDEPHEVLGDWVFYSRLEKEGFFCKFKQHLFHFKLGEPETRKKWFTRKGCYRADSFNPKWHASFRVHPSKQWAVYMDGANLKAWSVHGHQALGKVVSGAFVHNIRFFDQGLFHYGKDERRRNNSILYRYQWDGEDLERTHGAYPRAELRTWSVSSGGETVVHEHEGKISTWEPIATQEGSLR